VIAAGASPRIESAVIVAARGSVSPRSLTASELLPVPSSIESEPWMLESEPSKVRSSTVSVP
jgi:hypothetical protein